MFRFISTWLRLNILDITFLKDKNPVTCSRPAIILCMFIWAGNGNSTILPSSYHKFIQAILPETSPKSKAQFSLGDTQLYKPKPNPYLKTVDKFNTYVMLQSTPKTYKPF